MAGGRPRKLRRKVNLRSGALLRAVGYARVSTREQGESGLSLDHQRDAIRREVKHRGWSLVAEPFTDVSSGRSTHRRPALHEALALLDAGEADVLLATKYSRLSRSTVDFGELVRHSQERGWALVVTEEDFDTSSATGRLMAHMVIGIAAWEGETISERTRDALHVKKSELPKGTKLGRPEGPGWESIPAPVRRRIRTMRTRGWSLPKIAAKLEADGVPTARGGRWRASTVAKVLGAQEQEFDLSCEGYGPDPRS